jgi:hypothetical protein
MSQYDEENESILLPPVPHLVLEAVVKHNGVAIASIAPPATTTCLIACPELDAQGAAQGKVQDESAVGGAAMGPYVGPWAETQNGY